MGSDGYSWLQPPLREIQELTNPEQAESEGKPRHIPGGIQSLVILTWMHCFQAEALKNAKA